jgi:hypothetical protein
MLQGGSYVQNSNLVMYIRTIIPGDMSIALLGYQALSGWGYALFILLALLSIFEPVLVLLAVGHSGTLQRRVS